MTSKAHYRPDIDGLRAVSIVSVVLFHAFPEWPGVGGGFVGVDVFFVISGFLISSLIFGGLEGGSFSLGEFYSRRIRRIFPALLVVLIACVALGWFVLLAAEYQRLGKHVAGAAVFISNFLFWKEHGYFDALDESTPLLHLWSLGIEEQFYILWPPLLWLAWKRRWNFLAVAGPIAALSFALSFHLSTAQPDAAFYSPLARFWELLVGSLLAYWALRAKERPPQNVLSALGLALIVAGVVVISKERDFPSWWALMPTAGAAMVIAGGADAWLNRKVLASRPFVWLGLVSYPLYLWHWPLLSFLHLSSGEPPTVGQRLVAVLLSIALAWLTQLLVEKRLRFGGHGRQKTLALVAAMVLVGLAGLYRFATTAPDLRNPQLEELNRQFAWDVSLEATAGCQKQFRTRDYCLISNLSAPPDAVLIGDSHANHFYWGLRAFHEKKGQNLANLGTAGCPPVIGVDMKGTNTTIGCGARLKGTYDLILESPSIKSVYIAFWHNAYFDSRLEFTDALGAFRDEGDKQRFLTEAFVRTVNKLTEAGKDVTLIYDLPDLHMDIKKCFDLRPVALSKRTCAIDKTIFIQDFEHYDALVSELKKRTAAKVFDTHQYLEGNFPVGRDGKAMYRDYSHLSMVGSMYFSDKYP